MIRALNSDLAEVPYERSSLKPTLPFPLHVAGFYASTAVARLRSQTTYGGTSMPGRWYRMDEDLRAKIDGLLDDACDRSLFDADAIRERQRRHLDGEADEINALSGVTTVELWLQRHLD
jgi:asparagine synthase (glutamine-hydrolysing)